MAEDHNNSLDFDSSDSKDSHTDKSLVGKFKSIISTPLSKWFGKQEGKSSTVRRREVEFEDEINCMEPPLKRVKLPSNIVENDSKSVIFYGTSRTSTTSWDSVASTENHFQEPVAGPSGVKSCKLLSGITSASNNIAQTAYSSSELINGHKDSDSEESTSGYSSMARIGSKEHVFHSQQGSKQNSPVKNTADSTRSLFQNPTSTINRSLFTDRHLTANMNTSLSSRRPSFNASTFGSPNFVDKTISTKKIINSPFYNGRTIYGGASAYGRRLGRSAQDLRSSLKRSVQIKPINRTNENANLMLGKTARRILETLEQYSSPINDAKKIPNNSSKRVRRDGLLIDHVGANQNVRISSNRELQVPSVSDLLKMKQKARLQEGTEAVRQIAISSKSNLNTESFNLNVIKNQKEARTETEETKITHTRQKSQTADTGCDVKSNQTSSLPKIDFVLPPSVAPVSSIRKTGNLVNKILPVSSIASVETTTLPLKTKEMVETVQSEKQTLTSTEFKFSHPLVISENLKSIVAINNFKFSEPLRKSIQIATSFNFSMPNNKLPNLNEEKNNGETTSVKRSTSKIGKVIDILEKTDQSLMDKFKPALGSWECSVCMIRNQMEKTKCIACETPKSTASQPESKSGFEKPSGKLGSKYGASKLADSGFGDQFRLPASMWECPVCMIQNKNEINKCAACETPNPKSPAPSASSLPVFGVKFQPPPSTWECSTCLVRNKEDISKCIACETPKTVLNSNSTSFKNLYQMKSNQWECSVCMVKNENSKEKCQCCEAEKPGSTVKSVLPQADQKPVSNFKFGIDKASVTSFNFGIPSSTTTLPKPKIDPSIVFGEKANTTTAVSNFKFGIPSDSQKELNPPSQNKSNLSEPAKPAEPSTSVEPAIMTDTRTSEPPILQTGNNAIKPPEKDKVESSVAKFKFTFSPPKAVTTSDGVLINKTESPINTTKTVPSSDLSKKTFQFNMPPTNGTMTTLKKTDMTAAVSAPSTSLFSFGAKPATIQTQSNQTAKTNPVFSFGPSKVTAVTPFPSSTNTTSSSIFGSPNTAVSQTTKTQSFDLPAPSNAAIKQFSFKTTTDEPASKAPMFSFGQTATTTATLTQPSGFSFGAPTNKAPSSFNFTGSKPEMSNFNVPPPNNIFSGANAKNGTFNFGNMSQSNSSQKAGFSFGTAANNSSSPARPSFNFGSVTSAPAPATGGFNFAPAANTFDASVKPSFNFTDGSVTTFSAPPPAEGGLSAPVRKIKRAVRRTHQR